MGLSKAYSHTKWRFRQRFGGSLTKDDYLEMNRLILSGNGMPIYRNKNTQKFVYLIEYNEKHLAVGFDEKKKIIRTVFPIGRKWLQ